MAPPFRHDGELAKQCPVSLESRELGADPVPMGGSSLILGSAAGARVGARARNVVPGGFGSDHLVAASRRS